MGIIIPSPTYQDVIHGRVLPDFAIQTINATNARIPLDTTCQRNREMIKYEMWSVGTELKYGGILLFRDKIHRKC